MSDVTGNDILEIANASWRPGRQDYRGWQYTTAVGRARSQIELEDGLRGKAKRLAKKERQKEAEHTVSVMFNHARQQSEDRLSRVCAQADQVASIAAQVLGATDEYMLNGVCGQLMAAAGEDLQAFAIEIAGLLNGPLSAGFGAFDPSMIITLIMAIINAIKVCKGIVPAPVTP